MSAARTTRAILATAAPIAAAVLFAGSAGAAPPQSLGTALTFGCLNQGSLASITAVTAQAGPEANPGIPPGHVLFSTAPGMGPMPAAGQVSVAWLNQSTGQAGIVDLEGTYPNLAKVVNTGPGTVLTTVFGSVNLSSGPICNSTPAAGTVTVG
ncbi:hypothetical protein G6038_08365 [Rhodococcus sp. 14C212]|uniref:hypothetical protein n=1 Tax=Rhodococcus sp. 14C212 TaxID=2711209 RepID=UPI0013EBD943|nr:hypothetical protein [Rhodococcus sp. 14C212]NGP05501.1 hypothetical protein [Rhodococcus sp. 14C212]